MGLENEPSPLVDHENDVAFVTSTPSVRFTVKSLPSQTLWVGPTSTVGVGSKVSNMLSVSFWTQGAIAFVVIVSVMVPPLAISKRPGL